MVSPSFTVFRVMVPTRRDFDVSLRRRLRDLGRGGIETFLVVCPASLPAIGKALRLMTGAQGSSHSPLMWLMTWLNSSLGEKSTYLESSSASGAWPGAQ